MTVGLPEIMLPQNVALLRQLGDNLRMARLRRRQSATLVAERAGISRMTLYKVERGEPMVAIAAYLQVLFVLGLAQDFAQLAKDDVLGRKLQDLGMVTKKRAPKLPR